MAVPSFLRQTAVRPSRTWQPRVEFLEGRLCPSHNPYLAVTSYTNNSVMRYDELTAAPAPAEGQKGATFVPSRSCGLRSPLSVLYAPDGGLLVSGGEENNVLRYDPATGDCLGEFVEAGSGGLTVPTGMIFSPDWAYFYVASNFNNRILRYEYDGVSAFNPVRLIQDARLAGPVGMLFGPDGYLYVSTLNESSVLRYDPSTGEPAPAPGQDGANFVPPGSGGLSRAGGVVFGPDGNLYVASQNSNEILRFDGTTGDPLPVKGQKGAVFVTAGSGGLSRPAGILFGPGLNPCQPDLYVISLNTSNVLRYDGTTGESLGDFVEAGSGGLTQPRGLGFGNTDPVTLSYVFEECAGPGGAPGGHSTPGRSFALAVDLSPLVAGDLPHDRGTQWGTVPVAVHVRPDDLVPAVEEHRGVGPAKDSGSPNLVGPAPRGTAAPVAESDPILDFLALNLLGR